MITARVEGANELARSLSGVPATLAAETRLAMTASLTLIEADARRSVKQDTRQLMGSITSKISGSGAALTGEVGPSKRYGFWVEYGRRPGKQPPIDALLPWVRRHTGTFSIATRRRTGGRGQVAQDRQTAFLIARAIGKRGIPAAPFMAPALAKNLGKITALFEAIGVKVVARFR